MKGFYRGHQRADIFFNGSHMAKLFASTYGLLELTPRTSPSLLAHVSIAGVRCVCPCPPAAGQPPPAPVAVGVLWCDPETMANGRRGNSGQLDVVFVSGLKMINETTASPSGNERKLFLSIFG